MISTRWSVDASSFRRFRAAMAARSVVNATLTSAFVYDAVLSLVNAANLVSDPMNGVAVYDAMIDATLPGAITATGTVEFDQNGTTTCRPVI